MTNGGDPAAGMTKREKFALELMARFAGCPSEEFLDGREDVTGDIIASLAVGWADDLIDALNADE